MLSAEVRVFPMGLTNCYKFCPGVQAAHARFMKAGICSGYCRSLCSTGVVQCVDRKDFLT